MSPKTTASVLDNAEQTLTTARLGLGDLRSGAVERHLSGLRNVVVFGRAVTNVLQNLRSTEATFDQWYGPHVQQMQADPLMKFFYKLRSEVLKEGILPTSASTHIRQFQSQDMRRFGPPPPNAKSFFIGDRSGGSGWEVDLGDGQVTKYYVELPGDIGQVTLHLEGMPTQHLGADLEDDRVVTACAAYVLYLERLVRDAKMRFSGGA